MKPMLAEPDRYPEIPLAACPDCKTSGYMAIKAVRPRLRQRDGIDVEYTCPKCQTVLVTSLRPER